MIMYFYLYLHTVLRKENLEISDGCGNIKLLFISM